MLTTQPEDIMKASLRSVVKQLNTVRAQFSAELTRDNSLGSALS